MRGIVEMPLRSVAGLQLVLSLGPSLDGPTVQAWLEGVGGRAACSVVAHAATDACRVEIDEFDPSIAAVHVGGAVFWISAEHTHAARQVIPC